MKGVHKVLMASIVLALLSSNAMSLTQMSPYPRQPCREGSGTADFEVLPPAKQAVPNGSDQAETHPVRRPSISTLSEEEYTAKWYGDEPGFNMSLISSYKRLTFDGRAGGPSFSPDGRKLIFARDGDGPYENDIWMMDIDGSNLTQLTKGNPSDCQPSFLSDGIHFMYIKGGSPWMTICVQSLLDNSTKQITVSGMHPRVAANNMIVYISNRTTFVDAALENFIYLPEGMEGHWPHMNAHGTRIVFEEDSYNQYSHILLADLPNGTIRQLTFGRINHNEPAISPDGRWIVYNTHFSPPARNYSNLWLYDVTTGNQHQLTFGKTSDITAEFSPDGRHMAFASRRGNEGWCFDIWLLTLGEGC